MGEELNQKIYYAPIGSDSYEEPIFFDGEMEIKEFPVSVTTHENGLSSFSVQMSARVKRLSIKGNKLPRKKKKRLKTRLSKEIGIPTKDLRILTGGKNGNIKVEFEKDEKNGEQ